MWKDVMGGSPKVIFDHFGTFEVDANFSKSLGGRQARCSFSVLEAPEGRSGHHRGRYGVAASVKTPWEAPQKSFFIILELLRGRKYLLENVIFGPGREFL